MSISYIYSLCEVISLSYNFFALPEEILFILAGLVSTLSIFINKNHFNIKICE